VSAVNSAGTSAADQHHQDGLIARVALIVFKLADHTQAFSDYFFTRMALLASLNRRDQPVALHRRFDRPRIGIQHDAHKLARSSHLTAYPPGGARRHVATYARNRLMRGPHMRCEFGLHDMAALSAELHRFHVLYRAVAYLASNQEIRHRHDYEEHANPAPGLLPIGEPGETDRPPPPRERDPDWNQCQPNEEKDRDGDEQEQTDVGIVDMPLGVNRQKKEPGAARQRDQHHA
jgi:hypothetical protein